MAEASLDAFKAKDTWFVADWLKSNLEKLAQALLSFALYLKVFKNCLYYLRQSRVFSSKPCLLERFLGVGAFKCPGGCPGGCLRSAHTMGLVPATSPCNKSQIFKLRFDWYINAEGNEKTIPHDQPALLQIKHSQQILAQKVQDVLSAQTLGKSNWFLSGIKIRERTERKGHSILRHTLSAHKAAQQSS